MIRHNFKNIVDVLANTLINNVDPAWEQTYNETVKQASIRLDKINKLSDIGIEHSPAYEVYSSLIFDTFADSKEFMQKMLDKTTLTIHHNHISYFINYDVDDIYFNDDNDGMYIIDTLNIYLGLETKQD